jgi:hypothetical protein
MGLGGGAWTAGAAAAGPRSGSRNSHEANPKRLVSPAFDIEHQVMSEPNRTKPMVTASPRLRVVRMSADSDIDA